MEIKNRLLNFENKFIYQNNDWFAFSLDSVLLANFVTINPTDKRILDIATGNAPVPMLLSFRTKAKVWGVEVQKEIFDLAIKSVVENNMNDQIQLINDNIKNINAYFNSDFFDVITCNPPYFKFCKDSNVNENIVKTNARHEVLLTLEEVIDIASKYLKTSGKLALVHRTDRLIEIITLLKKYNLEPKKMQLVYPKINQDSNIVLIEAVKNGKIGMKILSPLVAHNTDGSYSEEVKKFFGGNLDVAK